MKILILMIMLISSSVHAIPEGAVEGTYEIRNQIATMINLNGHLCAEVKWFSALKNPDLYEVNCVLYRGGNGSGVYILNARTGTAFRQ